MRAGHGVEQPNHGGHGRRERVSERKKEEVLRKTMVESFVGVSNEVVYKGAVRV